MCHAVYASTFESESEPFPNNTVLGPEPIFHLFTDVTINCPPYSISDPSFKV